MRKIGVLTSGGDSPGMNAAIRAVVRCGMDAGFEVWGIERGFEGLLDGELRVMDRSSVGDILHRGGTVLKTARSERFMAVSYTHLDVYKRQDEAFIEPFITERPAV